MDLADLIPAPMPDTLDASWLADHAGRAERVDEYAQAVHLKRSADLLRAASQPGARPAYQPPPRPPQVPGELAAVDSGPLADWAAARRQLDEATAAGGRSAIREAATREAELRTYAEEAWGTARPAIDAYAADLAAWHAGPQSAPAAPVGPDNSRW